MTFILGMQCDDGVLIVSDSASIAISGKVTNTGIKSIYGVRKGQPFALAFAGYAGFENGDLTLSVIDKAVGCPTGDILNNIGTSLQKWLYVESFRGRKRTRKEFRKHASIRVFLSTQWNEWWVIHAKRNGHASVRVAPRQIMMGRPGPGRAAWEELLGALPACPSQLAEGKQIAGALFELAARLYPDAVRFPGKATTHNGAGIHSISFGIRAELI